MTDIVFLDTNVLLYTFDEADARKRDIALGLVRGVLVDGTGVISSQVVQEFLNVATRKFAVPMDEARASAYLAGVLAPLCRIFTSIALCERALGVRECWRFSWYDSLMVAGALEAGATVLCSEDLQHGQRIETLIVRNPFLDERPAHDR